MFVSQRGPAAAWTRRGVASVSLCAAAFCLAPGPLAAEVAGPPAPRIAGASSTRGVDARERARQGHWKLDAAFAGTGQLADLVSTEFALTRPGTQEGNPLVASRAVRIPVKLAVAAGTTVACRALRQRGKHTQARLLAIASFAVGAAAAVHNSRVATPR